MTKLRAVAVDERGKVKPASILEATAADEKTLLVALRDKLAREIDKGVPPHALRGIIAEVRDLDRSIRALEVREDGDDILDATRVPDEAFDATSV